MTECDVIDTLDRDKLAWMLLIIQMDDDSADIANRDWRQRAAKFSYEMVDSMIEASKAK